MRDEMQLLLYCIVYFSDLSVVCREELNCGKKSSKWMTPLGVIATRRDSRRRLPSASLLLVRRRLTTVATAA
jgi:hypothetical protein